jgi:hypothetical protein
MVLRREYSVDEVVTRSEWSWSFEIADSSGNTLPDDSEGLTQTHCSSLTTQDPCSWRPHSPSQCTLDFAHGPERQRGTRSPLDHVANGPECYGSSSPHSVFGL